MSTAEIRCFFPFIGLGVGALGFQRGVARVGNLHARFRCIGGFDNDVGVVHNASRLLGEQISVMDAFSRDQYIAFHGAPPPDGWREMTPGDVRRAAGNERPHIVFTSPPCKGYSGLTSEVKSRTPKYQALNELALRGIFLTLEAWADDPPEFFLMENVPRILSRGAHLVQIFTSLLHSYGYAIATPQNFVHNCGEIGGLAQNRNRALIVARHMEKVPNFLYQPARKPLKAVGDVLGKLPLPGHPTAGDLHRLPNLSWKTWVRLAFVQAGKDWRSLDRLTVENGYLRDFALEPAVDWHSGVLGVNRWDQTAPTIAGRSSPTNGGYSIADPRWQSPDYDCGQYGVQHWHQPSRTVIGLKSPGQGGYAVADPRAKAFADGYGVQRWGDTSGAVKGESLPSNGKFAVADPRAGHRATDEHFSNVYRVVKWGEAGPTISAGSSPSSGGVSVADPRCVWSPDAHCNKFKITDWAKPASSVIGATRPGSGGAAVADPRGGTLGRATKYKVTAWEQPSRAVIGASTTGEGAFAVADPRPSLQRGRGDHYLTAGHYGVVPWQNPAYAVTGSLQHDNGHGSVADPRLPGPDERLRCLIVAEDGTWHRPFTTMENAALQSIFDPEEFMHFQLTGGSDQKMREWIGNAVPRDAAAAMAGVFGQALLLAWSGETHIVSGTPVWVQPIIAAIQCGTENGQ